MIPINVGVQLSLLLNTCQSTDIADEYSVYKMEHLQTVCVVGYLCIWKLASGYCALQNQH